MSCKNLKGGLLSSLSEHVGFATTRAIISLVWLMSSLHSSTDLFMGFLAASVNGTSDEPTAFAETSSCHALMISDFLTSATEEAAVLPWGASRNNRWYSSIPSPFTQCLTRRLLSRSLSSARRANAIRRMFVFKGSRPAMIFEELTSRADPLPTFTKWIIFSRNANLACLSSLKLDESNSCGAKSPSGKPVDSIVAVKMSWMNLAKTTIFSHICLWDALVCITAIFDSYLNGGLLKSLDDNLGFENRGWSNAIVSLIALCSPAMFCYTLC